MRSKWSQCQSQAWLNCVSIPSGRGCFCSVLPPTISQSCPASVNTDENGQKWQPSRQLGPLCPLSLRMLLLALMGQEAEGSLGHCRLGVGLGEAQCGASCQGLKGRSLVQAGVHGQQCFSLGLQLPSGLWGCCKTFWSSGPHLCDGKMLVLQQDMEPAPGTHGCSCSLNHGTVQKFP